MDNIALPVGIIIGMIILWFSFYTELKYKVACESKPVGTVVTIFYYDMECGG